MAKKYNWILFDADNTLMDFDSASYHALRGLMTALKIPSTKFDEYWLAYMGYNHEVWRLFEEGEIDTLTLRSQRFDLLLNKMEIHSMDGATANTIYLDRMVGYSEMLDGALELIQKLQDFNLAIITNGLKEVQRRRFEKLELEPYFKHLIVSDEIGKAKPDEAFFDHTFELIDGPSKSEVLIVGDNLMSDIKGGNNYGVDTVWYNPKNVANHTQEIPSFEIRDLNELLNIVL